MARIRPADDAWEAYRPAELGHRLAGIQSPWCVVGGWALDLWHGRETRTHDDLEFTILREDFATFRRSLSGLDLYTARDGVLEYLPDTHEPAAGIMQVWGLDTNRQRWRVDLMFEPGTPDTWVYKRDPAVRRPRAEMIRTTSNGLPYLSPAAILLFKAKYRRDKDEIDFGNALPKLDAPDRIWLKAALQAMHPEHAWIDGL